MRRYVVFLPSAAAVIAQLAIFSYVFGGRSGLGSDGVGLFVPLLCMLATVASFPVVWFLTAAPLALARSFVRATGVGSVLLGLAAVVIVLSKDLYGPAALVFGAAALGAGLAAILVSRRSGTAFRVASGLLGIVLLASVPGVFLLAPLLIGAGLPLLSIAIM